MPRSQAWRITVTKTLRSFFEGLTGAPQAAREFIDDVYEDLFPDTTRELREWEKQFGLEPESTEEVRRQALAAEWAATGGQSPSYIQGVLQTAGFDVYVHEWWEPPNVAPRTLRDPHDYTDIPLVGTVQDGEPLAQCGEPSAQCNAFLANDPHYFDNKDLTPRAPPPIPADPATWPYFIYIGAETFPDHATIPIERRAAFERLILKMRPLQNWIVTLVDYDDVYVDNLGVTYTDNGAVDPYLANP